MQPCLNSVVNFIPWQQDNTDMGHLCSITAGYRYPEAVERIRYDEFSLFSLCMTLLRLVKLCGTES